MTLEDIDLENKRVKIDGVWQTILRSDWIDKMDGAGNVIGKSFFITTMAPARFKISSLTIGSNVEIQTEAL